MKITFPGRVVFGASAVLFGVIALMWHDANTWENLQHLWSLPFGTAIGLCLMVAQIAGGIGVIFRFRVRLASIVLCVVYLCFSLACIPDIIAAQNIYQRYGGSFFVFFSFFCGALALYAATETDQTRALVLSRVAHYGLGVCTISFTLVSYFFFSRQRSWFPNGFRPARCFGRFLRQSHLRSLQLPFSPIGERDLRYA